MTTPQAFRRAQLRNANLRRGRGKKARKESVPAPLGGWNTRDSRGNMNALDAFLMDNWVPGETEVRVRNGYVSHATGVGSGLVNFLTEYFDGKNRFLIAASKTNIYDATAAGAATSLGGGFVNGNWASVNFDGKLGMVNGRNLPQVITNQVGTPTLSAMTISGPVDVKDLVDINVFKERTYFIEEDSTDFWYSAVNTMGGTLTKFPLSRVARRGGKLMTMRSWTVDGGSGPDDFAVFIFDSGEVIVYQGTNPGDSTAWALVGRYNIGKPVHRRGIASVGGAIFAITETDYVRLPDVFKTEGFQPSTKLSGIAKESVAKHRNKLGWDAAFYPNGGWLLANVPQGQNVWHQHVLNLATNAAFRITGWNTRALGVYSGDLYFGGFDDGIIYKADTGDTDNGASIVADAKQADRTFTEERQITAYRTITNAAGTQTTNNDIAVDYGPHSDAQSITTSAAGTDWDAAWGSEWATNNGIRDEWLLATGTGQAFSLRLRVTANQSVSYLRSDFLFKPAGPL